MDEPEMNGRWESESACRIGKQTRSLSMAAVKLVAYCRVSTAEQASGLSLEAQFDEIAKYAKQRGAVIVSQFAEVASGVANRPILQQALDALSAADGLIVWKLDRLTRSASQLQKIIDRLQESSKSLWIASDGLEFTFDGAGGLSTLSGKILLTVLGIVAEMERALIMERSILGKVALLKQGIWMGGSKPPFGYRLDKNRKLVPYKPEAIIVRKIYESYAKGGVTLYDLADKFGMKVCRIHAILLNPVYKGEYRFHVGARKKYRSHHSRAYFQGDGDGVIKVKVPAIVDEELWEKVQKRLKGNKTRDHRGWTKGWWSGLCVCDNCGTALGKFGAHGRWVYLRCNNRSCSDKAYIRLDLLEETLLDLLHRSMHLVLEYLRDEIAQETIDVATLLKRRDEYLSLFRQGLISYDELERELRDLQLLIKTAQEAKARSQLAEALELLQKYENFADAWTRAPMAIKDLLLRRIITRIHIRRYDLVAIEGRIPFEVTPKSLIVRPEWRYEDAERIIMDIFKRKGRVSLADLRRAGIGEFKTRRKFLLEFCYRHNIHPQDLCPLLKLREKDFLKDEWRQPPSWLRRIYELHEQGLGHRRIAKIVGMDPKTVWLHLKKREG